MESCISSRLSVTINASSHASWSNISTTQSLTSLCWECWFIPTISPNSKALTSCGTKIHLPKPRPKTQALQHVMGILSPSPPIKGSFSFTIPLRHIFGFADDYNKIVYGFKHELSLVRDSDDNAILLLPSTTWRKSTWVRSLGLFLTSFLLSDEKKTAVVKDHSSKSKIDCGFRIRQCDSTSVTQTLHFHRRLYAKSGRENQETSS